MIRGQTADGRHGDRVGARAERRRRRMGLRRLGQPSSSSSSAGTYPGETTSASSTRRARPRPRPARPRATRAGCARIAVTSARDGRRGAGAASAAPASRRRAEPSDAGRSRAGGWRRVDHLRDGAPQPGHRLDRGGDRLRRAQAPPRPAPRLRPRPPRRRQRADRVGARARRRAGARVPAPHHAARARRDARELPVGQPPRADPPRRADDGARGPRAHADRRRRRRPAPAS